MQMKLASWAEFVQLTIQITVCLRYKVVNDNGNSRTHVVHVPLIW